MVDLFFVISGFVIGLSYMDRLATRQDAARFVWLRFGRLYPLHLAMLLVFAVFEITRVMRGFSPNPANTLESFVSNLFLAHSLGLHDGLSFNYPSWSISVEFYTYLTFAAVVLLVGPGRRLILASSVLVIASVYALVVGFDMRLERAGYDVGILRCFAGFFLGVLTFVAYRWARNRAAGVTSALASKIAPASVAALVAFLCVREPDTLTGYYILPLIVVVVLSLALAPNKGFVRWLDSAPLVWLGRVSYSVYMVHAAVLIVFERLISKLLRPESVQLAGHDYPTQLTTAAEGTAFLLVYIVVVLIVSHFTYAWIEHPFRERSRALATRWFGVRSPASTSRPAVARRSE